MPEDRIDSLLHKVPVSRRKAVKSLLLGAFAAPVVSSFPMDGRFGIDSAKAGHITEHILGFIANATTS